MRFDLGLEDFTTPSFCVLADEDFEFLMPDLLVACLDFTVEVREGAIVYNYGRGELWFGGS